MIISSSESALRVDCNTLGWKVGCSQFADVSEVDKGGFLGSHSDNLRRLHDKLPLLSGYHVWVLLPHDVEDSVQKLTGMPRGKYELKSDPKCMCFRIRITCDVRFILFFPVKGFLGSYSSD